MVNRLGGTTGRPHDRDMQNPQQSCKRAFKGKLKNQNLWPKINPWFNIIGNEVLVMSLSFNSWAISPSQEWGFIARPYFLLSLCPDSTCSRTSLPLLPSHPSLACCHVFTSFMDCIPLNCKLKQPPFSPEAASCQVFVTDKKAAKTPVFERSWKKKKSPQLTCFHKKSFQRRLEKMCGKGPLTHKLHPPEGFQGGRQKM